MNRVAKRVTTFVAKKQVTFVQVMHVALSCGVLPLQARARPMWAYTREGVTTRAIRDGFCGNKTMKEMLSLLFKGK